MPQGCIFVFASILLSSSVGCNTSGLSPVEGVVKLDGVPLANASIQFIPQGEGRDATGGTNANGEFAMSTNNPRDGVMRGTYKVIITPAASAPAQQFESADEAMKAASAQRQKPVATNFPWKYTRQDQTPLTQVVPIKEKKIVIDLKSS